MGTTILTTATAEALVSEVLTAYGASAENAATVAAHLVSADLAGVRSHGLIRLPQYVDEILAGDIDAAAVPTATRAATGRVDVDGHRSFGQVACMFAVTEGSTAAQETGLAIVTVRNMGHSGRIGAYADALGRLGFLSVLFGSGARTGHRVAPFNGREARLATNPLSFSVPTTGSPIVGDFSTATASEGRARLLRNLGQQMPPDTLLDSDGRPTTDPGVLYGDVPGTILPLGGSRLGYRGFALALLAESFATILAGDETSDPNRIQNNLALVIAAVDRGFASRADRMASYILSSAPRDAEPVYLPGGPEQHRQAASDSVSVDDHTWNAIRERAEQRALRLPA